MRPLRLDLAGFAVFREPTTVDFTDADFFALVGPTGSGKSTVLDAICFALYGTVPRWNDRRAIANALAPSAAEARVRLIFESGGARFAATRVVRRDGKGKVTHHARRPGAAAARLRPVRLDTGLDAGDLGEVLAGTPAEMDEAVLDAVGLPFEQFTSCVILPQGQFAEFLHAKPAARQQILVNLLGPARLREGAGAGDRGRAAGRGAAGRDRPAGGRARRRDRRGARRGGRAAGRDASTGRRRRRPAYPTLPEARASAEGGAGAAATLDADLRKLDRGRGPGRHRRRRRQPPPRPGRPRPPRRTGWPRPRSARRSCAARWPPPATPTTLRRLLDLHAERAQLAESLGAGGRDARGGRRRARQDGRGLRARASRSRTVAAAAIGARGGGSRGGPDRRPGRHAAPAPGRGRAVPGVRADGRRGAADAGRAAAGRGERGAGRGQGRRPPRPTRDAAGRRTGPSATWRSTLAVRGRSGSSSPSGWPHWTAALAGAAGVDDLREQLRVINELQTAAGRRGRPRCAEARRRARAGPAPRRSGRRADQRRVARVRREPRRGGPARPAAGRPRRSRRGLGRAGRVGGDDGGGPGVRTRHRRRSEAAAAVAAVERRRRDIAALFEAAAVGAPSHDEYARAATTAVEQARAAHDRLAERRAQADQLRAEREVSRPRAGSPRRWPSTCGPTTSSAGCWPRRWTRWSTARRRSCASCPAGSTTWATTRASSTSSTTTTRRCAARCARCPAARRSRRRWPWRWPCPSSSPGLSTAAASLESIMLDEGFGTLDAATLDTVAATLENLAARGDRMVGVVTHVARSPSASRCGSRCTRTRVRRTWTGSDDR